MSDNGYYVKYELGPVNMRVDGQTVDDLRLEPHTRGRVCHTRQSMDEGAPQSVGAARLRSLVQHPQVLPEAADAIVLEDGVAADDGQALSLSLRDEHTVEWVLVMSGQTGDTKRVIQSDGHYLETIAAESLFGAIQKRLSVQLADCSLDGQFPGRNNRHEDFAVGSRDRLPRCSGQPLATLEPPQERLRIKQQSHSMPQSLSSSSVSGSKASGAYQILPFRLP